MPFRPLFSARTNAIHISVKDLPPGVWKTRGGMQRARCAPSWMDADACKALTPQGLGHAAPVGSQGLPVVRRSSPAPAVHRFSTGLRARAGALRMFSKGLARIRHAGAASGTLAVGKGPLRER